MGKAPNRSSSHCLRLPIKGFPTPTCSEPFFPGGQARLGKPGERSINFDKQISEGQAQPIFHTILETHARQCG